MNESDSDQNQAPVKIKNKRIAGVLAIFLGIFGAHRFYMGRKGGVFYIILSIIGLFPFVFILSVYEGIKYLVVSEEKWNKILNPQLQTEKEKKRAKISNILVILVAIGLIVWMANIALNAPSEYIARAEVAEAMRFTSAFKPGITKYYKDNGVWPDSLTAIDKPTSGKYVEHVKIHTGASESGNIIIQTTMKSSGVNSNIASKTLSLSSIDGGKTWNCGLLAISGTNLEAKYLPGSCKP